MRKMAVKETEEGQGTTHEAAEPEMVGGAPGVPQSAAPPAPKMDPPPIVPQKRYMVMETIQISYGGMIVLKRGKIVDEYSYDMELLTKQGVQLKEVT